LCLSLASFFFLQSFGEFLSNWNVPHEKSLIMDSALTIVILIYLVSLIKYSVSNGMDYKILSCFNFLPCTFRLHMSPLLYTKTVNLCAILVWLVCCVHMEQESALPDKHPFINWKLLISWYRK
jgi:hypothetical protein